MANGRSQLEVAELMHQVWNLRCNGMPVWRIGKHLGIGNQYVYKLIDQMLEQLRPPAEQVAEQRAISLERLDGMTAAALKVLQTMHYVVDHGQVVAHPQTGEPLLDDGPVLAAIDRLHKIEERRARLLGLDMPQLVEVEMKIKAEADAAFEDMVKRARAAKAAAKAFVDIAGDDGAAA